MSGKMFSTWEVVKSDFNSRRVLDVIDLALEGGNLRLATLASQALFNLSLSSSIEDQGHFHRRILTMTSSEIPDNVKEILLRVIE
jgi:hypothetical protein